MRKIKLILLATILASAAYLPAPALAASATLYLSPSSRSVAEGSTFTVSVRENSGSTTVNAVQANLSYPADKLEFLSIGSSSAFSIAAQSSGGSGLVKIARGALPAVSGDQLVATVSFRVKVSSGSATVTFASGSGVTKGPSFLSSSKSGGTYTFTKPAPAPKEAPKDTKAPAIKTVTIQPVAQNSRTSLVLVLLIALAAFAFWRYIWPLIKRRTKPPAPQVPINASISPKPQIITPAAKPDDKNPPPSS